MAWTPLATLRSERADRPDRPDRLGRPERLDRLTDRDVKSTVVHRLRENPYTQGSRIKVEVSGGVVRLGGEVESPLAKAVASGDAEVVPGVVDVTNELVVKAAA